MNCWIGLNDRQRGGRWVYSDGTNLKSFDNWSPGEPDYNNFGSKRCAVINMDDFLWDNRNCYKNYYYICQFEEQQCKTGMVKDASYCYQLSTESATFDVAQEKCKEQGGYLINIKSQETKIIVERMMIPLDRKLMSMDEHDILGLLESDDRNLPQIWIGNICREGIFGDGNNPLGASAIYFCQLLENGSIKFKNEYYQIFYMFPYTCRFDLLPLNEEQSTTLPLNYEQSTIQHLNEEQSTALPLNEEQSTALPLNEEQSTVLSLNEGTQQSTPESEKLFGDLSDGSVGDSELIPIIVGTSVLIGVICALVVAALILKRKELLRRTSTAVSYRKDMTVSEDEVDNV